MTDRTKPPSILLSDLAFQWPGRAGFSLSVPDFEVPAGQKLFLLGESGSGKSTLLSLICGIAQPQSGRVTVSGTDLTQMRATARDRFRANRIGVIFQMFNLLPYASALDNILLPLAFAPDRAKRVANPVAEALRLTSALGLDADLVRGSRAGQLSIGQQQRIAAARALIGAPGLIIADEPTSALDASSQDAFVRLLMEQVDSVGATLMMVSHDARLSERFDRVMDLRDIARTERSAA